MNYSKRRDPNLRQCSDQDSLTLSSNVIFDNRDSTLKLENPCPDGPSLRARVNTIAKQMYAVHAVHIAKLFQPSAPACIPFRTAQRSTESAALINQHAFRLECTRLARSHPRAGPMSRPPCALYH